jgi:hypothetical protein
VIDCGYGEMVGNFFRHKVEAKWQTEGSERKLDADSVIQDDQV